MPVEARTHGNGSSEMRVLLSTYESRGDVEPMVGLAVRLQALAAQFDTVVVAEGCDALAASGMMSVGVWL